MRTRKTIITLTATTLFLSLSALPMLGHRVGTGYATQSPQETTIETATTYTTNAEILVESGTFGIVSPGGAAAAKVGSSAGFSETKLTCQNNQRYVEGAIQQYLAANGMDSLHFLEGEVDNRHPLMNYLKKAGFEEAPRCITTNVHYIITKDGRVQECPAHGYYNRPGIPVEEFLSGNYTLDEDGHLRMPEGYLPYTPPAEVVAKVGSSSGESSAEFTCWAQQRVIEGSVSYYLSQHPELTTRDLMGEVNPNHPLVANQVIAEAYKCPHTNTYYRITSDGTVKSCSSHGYLIGNYGD